MSWAYRIEESAVRDLRNLGPSAAAEIREYLNMRVEGCENPTSFGKPLRGSKHGLWRYRVRDWRVVCKLDEHMSMVVVVAVGHRSLVYGD